MVLLSMEFISGGHILYLADETLFLPYEITIDLAGPKIALSIDHTAHNIYDKM